MPVQLVQGSEQTLLTTSSRRQILGTMSWLLHPEPLGLTPFLPGRECQRLASGKFLYQVWLHQFLGGDSLSGKPDKHRVKAGKTRLGSIPVSWAMATTGQRCQNQCLIWLYSRRDKRRGSLPGIHW